jgi:signal transduction histidine kinase
MKNEINNIEEVKHQIINTSLIVTSIIGSLAYLISLYRFLQIGFHFSFVFNFFIVAIVVSMTWIRDSLSLTLKTYTLIALIFLLSLFDTMNYGLLSSARIYLVLIPLFSVVSLPFRRTVIIFITGMVCFLFIGYLHYKGFLVIPPEYVPDLYVLELYPWIIIAVHVTMVSIIILLVIRKFILAYSGFINNLELVVKERTKDLETAMEELIVTNEELSDHKLVIESTLKNLQNTQNHLVHSEKMASLGVLSAGVAHEINNPLNFINGGILGIENYIHENLNEHMEALSPMIEGIHEGVRRAADIVTSLNHYSRRDDMSGNFCEIHAIIDNCLVMLQSQLKFKVMVYKHYTEKLFTLFGNEGKLHQAFLNLLLNAIQAIEEKGTITIHTTLEGNNLIVSITDTGCGISKEDLPKITDPFFTTKDTGKGTGLGLSITYNIIQELKGTLIFESQPGKGTKAIIIFPVTIQKS